MLHDMPVLCRAKVTSCPCLFPCTTGCCLALLWCRLGHVARCCAGLTPEAATVLHDMDVSGRWWVDYDTLMEQLGKQPIASLGLWLMHQVWQDYQRLYKIMHHNKVAKFCSNTG